jgi:hypothetical protein
MNSQPTQHNHADPHQNSFFVIIFGISAKAQQAIKKVLEPQSAYLIHHSPFEPLSTASSNTSFCLGGSIAPRIRNI